MVEHSKSAVQLHCHYVDDDDDFWSMEEIDVSDGRQFVNELHAVATSEGYNIVDLGGPLSLSSDGMDVIPDDSITSSSIDTIVDKSIAGYSSDDTDRTSVASGSDSGSDDDGRERREAVKSRRPVHDLRMVQSLNLITDVMLPMLGGTFAGMVIMNVILNTFFPIKLVRK